jgi:hypothetical protein
MPHPAFGWLALVICCWSQLLGTELHTSTAPSVPQGHTKFCSSQFVQCQHAICRVYPAQTTNNKIKSTLFGESRQPYHPQSSQPYYPPTTKLLWTRMQKVSIANPVVGAATGGDILQEKQCEGMASHLLPAIETHH